MPLRCCVIWAVAGLALVGGCSGSAPEAKPTDGPIVVVSASYPGANARVVADYIAAPIEQQVNGVEGYMQMESESRNDGRYVARVRFGPNVDPRQAVKRVRNRVARAEAQLPEAVRRAGVAVTVGTPERGKKPVAIAVEDRGDVGQAELHHQAAAVVKRLTTAGAAREPETFPGPPVKQVFTDIDRDRCAQAGVTVAAVERALRKAGPAATIDALKKVTVASAKGDKVPLGSVVTFHEGFGPAVVYRVNLYPSVRIMGLPPKGQTAAEAAARWVELARDELGPGFAVETMTGE